MEKKKRVRAGRLVDWKVEAGGVESRVVRLRGGDKFSLAKFLRLRREALGFPRIEVESRLGKYNGWMSAVEAGGGLSDGDLAGLMREYGVKAVVFEVESR